MGRKRKYDNEDDAKAAKALQKKMQRSVAKQQKMANETNFQWISQYLLEVANQVTQNVERRKADATQRATKRSAVKEAANILPKRQKYAK